MSNYICCDGIARRDFIRVGAISGFGLAFSLQNFLAQAAAETTTLNGKAKAAIFVRLGGGRSEEHTSELQSR